MSDKYKELRELVADTEGPHKYYDTIAELLRERDALLEALNRVTNGCDFESEDEWAEWHSAAVELIEAAKRQEGV